MTDKVSVTDAMTGRVSEPEPKRDSVGGSEATTPLRAGNWIAEPNKLSQNLRIMTPKNTPIDLHGAVFFIDVTNATKGEFTLRVHIAPPLFTKTPPDHGFRRILDFYEQRS